MYKYFLISVLIVIVLVLLWASFQPQALWVFVILGPLILLGLYDLVQKKHTILRNFPLIGHFRYLFESIRPEINQYFVESDIEGRPFNRINRSIIYQRAKDVLDKEPFGTRMDYYETGYEWLLHSASPVHELKDDMRITIGGPDCKKPYSASILNISALSYGSLSGKAIMAMNAGAEIDDFAHNTGEGGISKYHTYYGGDLIWQVGTGYFGCRTEDGNFDEELFEQNANLEQVKMIEIKLSQGAKPGQGGILPAKKNSDEIAKARKVAAGVDIISPAYHKAFSSPIEMMEFIQKVRKLSNGKPVGFKLCIGQKVEFLAICKAMIETGIKPDFISVDGAEGGTGAAPLEYANRVGMPLVEGLSFVSNALIGFDLKKDIKVLAGGKVVSGFDMIKYICLGADACYSARAMMMAVGCIQALRCHNNTCPTGVTTHDPTLTRGLVVNDKKFRVANYHKETVKSLLELCESIGINDLSELNRSFIAKRTGPHTVNRLDELYPYAKAGSLQKPPFPEGFHDDMMNADPNTFHSQTKLIEQDIRTKM